MLFTGREVRIGRYLVRIGRYHFHDRGQVFPYPDRARPVNNVFIFLYAILNQFHTKFQCCELDLRSVVFVTLLQVWLTNSQDDMTKKHL